MLRIAILGSTGSIGQSALSVVAAHPDRVRVIALAAGENIARFIEQVAAFAPETIAMSTPRALADACHALGGSYKGRSVGTLADLNVFSLHPVKAMTTGEGGVITTEGFEIAHQMRRFRNHGITSDHFEREQQGSWLYEMVDLGYNYRLNDFQCALGISQLRRLSHWLERRQAIAARYDEVLAGRPEVMKQRVRSEVRHAYHLYVIRIDPACWIADRARIFTALRAEGIGVNVHYLPVHLHPYYRERFGTGPGLCPKAEAAYEQVLSLPIFPGMNEQDVDDVIEALWKVISAYAIGTRSAAFAAAR
jgi:perosamine synthetase